MTEAIIVGWIDSGRRADNGETMKNQLLIKRLGELGVRCREMDFKGWRRRPWILLRLAWNMMAHKRATLILSSSAGNIYPMLRLMERIGWKQHTVHWVIGATIGAHVAQHTMQRDILDYADRTVVESPLLQKQLTEYGIHNVVQVPNFKPISYFPDIQPRVRRYVADGNHARRFVFLSRITPEKGCEYIIEAARRLNAAGLADRFTVDFYGSIADDYRRSFERQVSEIPNVRYCGFLNLREAAGYDTLAGYDAMLFPTYYPGECFAGVFIDAFISGLPIIASDWAHNTQFMTDGETALIVPTHDTEALCDRMKGCIDGCYNLAAMASAAQLHAATFSSENVITPKLLKELEITR